MDPSPLSPLEARVLGVLIEKQRSVPDTYPMSLNALVAGCNQKTSRSPIMNASEAEVLEALDALKHRSLVVETSGGRVMRYAHNAERALGLPSQSVALLATLALRGPQTAAELRQRSDRLHVFAAGEVEATLERLGSRDLVARADRRPGEKGERYRQLLGEEQAKAEPVVSGPSLEERVARLEEEVARLRDRLDG